MARVIALAESRSGLMFGEQGRRRLLASFALRGLGYRRSSQFDKSELAAVGEVRRECPKRNCGSRRGSWSVDEVSAKR